jgi:hypothetical protein
MLTSSTTLLLPPSAKDHTGYPQSEDHVKSINQPQYDRPALVEIIDTHGGQAVDVDHTLPIKIDHFNPLTINSPDLALCVGLRWSGSSAWPLLIRKLRGILYFADLKIINALRNRKIAA